MHPGYKDETLWNKKDVGRIFFSPGTNRIYEVLEIDGDVLIVRIVIPAPNDFLNPPGTTYRWLTNSRKDVFQFLDYTLP